MGRPTVIAHRTCPLDAPENSVEGITRALALGADFVEVDVRLTADGVAVLAHDPTLWRIARRPWPLRLTPSRRVLRQRRRDDGRISTLAEALAALPPDLGVAIDVKDPRAAGAVLDAVREHHVTDRTLLWSQHLSAVRTFAQHGSDMEVSLLRDAFGPKAERRFLDDAKSAGAQGISAHWDAVTPQFVELCHGLGLRVYSWCQDLAVQASKAALLDGIVTDWVAEARAGLTQPEP